MLDTVTSPSRTQSWALDPQGNPTSLTTNGATQTASFNRDNQFTSDSGGSHTPVYDNNGNLLTDPSGNTYTFDAWNRMMQFNGFPAYGYDALNRQDVYFTSSNYRYNYFDQSWQTIETQNSSSSTTTAQYVWSLSGIDNLVLRDDNAITGNLGIAGSGLGRRLYVDQDANSNVTALLNTTGAVQERFVYDPYGAVTVLTPTWGSGSDSYNWAYLFQGQRYDSATGLYNFRNREYNPSLQRFMQEDPAGYVDGGNRYQFVDDSPTEYIDPIGLQLTNPNESATPPAGAVVATSGISVTYQTETYENWIEKGLNNIHLPNYGSRFGDDSRPWHSNGTVMKFSVTSTFRTATGKTQDRLVQTTKYKACGQVVVTKVYQPMIEVSDQQYENAVRMLVHEDISATNKSAIAAAVSSSVVTGLSTSISAAVAAIQASLHDTPTVYTPYWYRVGDPVTSWIPDPKRAPYATTTVVPE